MCLNIVLIAEPVLLCTFSSLMPFTVAMQLVSRMKAHDQSDMAQTSSKQAFHP